MTKAEYFETVIANCKANLAGPNVRYANGRMSHDVNQEVLENVIIEFEDYKLDFGLFNAYGRLVGYQEESETA